MGEDENVDNSNVNCDNLDFNTLSSAAYIRVEDDVPERDYDRKFSSKG